MKKSSGAYASAKKNGWLDQICGHMKELKKPSGYWTKERCTLEAKKYKKRNKFKKGSGSAFDSACRNGWLDGFFPKRTRINNLNLISFKSGNSDKQSENPDFWTGT